MASLKKSCYVGSLAALVSFFGKKLWGFGYSSTSVLEIKLLRVRACVFLLPWENPAGLMMIQSFLSYVFGMGLCKCDLQMAPGPSDFSFISW